MAWKRKGNRLISIECGCGENPDPWQNVLNHKFKDIQRIMHVKCPLKIFVDQNNLNWSQKFPDMRNK